ncbi:hypothetical protein ACO0LC_11100 [Undibacterium sp. JH2W]|uniref:hypothetical protein n=1 Tax=Undibacterium sp. JH2W TaxID=3413037 RepID=UPI003BF09734
MFLLIFFLLIYLSIVKYKLSLLAAAINWASEESMQIIEPKKIEYFCVHRGPPEICFQAKNSENHIYEIRLKLDMRMVQHLRQIIKDGGAAYDTKLVSKKRL